MLAIRKYMHISLFINCDKNFVFAIVVHVAHSHATNSVFVVELLSQFVLKHTAIVEHFGSWHNK